MAERSISHYFNKCEKALGELTSANMLGIRMALYGSRLAGVSISTSTGRNRLIVFVESDRGIADAISAVTGCTLGKRSLKFHDYGIAGATFVNIKTKESARVVAKTSIEKYIETHFYKWGNSQEMEKVGYKVIADELLFKAATGLAVNLDHYDLPGAVRKRVLCDSCGVPVTDNRQVVLGAKAYCRPCVGTKYWDSGPVDFTPVI